MAIDWGIIDPNAYQRGAQMSQGIFDRVRQEQTRSATGNALNALLRDPNATPESLNRLATLNPEAAAQLIKFQQAQQDRQRETQFRGALVDYYGNAPSPAMNALMPTGGGAGMTGDVPPPLSAAPPPPADWQARVGPDGMKVITSAASGGANGMPEAGPVTPSLGGQALQPIDPSGDLGLPAPAQESQQAAPDTPMPPEIARAASSADPGARNAAFRRMMQIDPVQAMKIQSDERDRTLDAMEDSVKAFRWASEALSNARDDATYKQILGRVQQATAPLGLDIASMVPGTHPGPEGIRQLQYQALDISQRLAAIDRRFSAEADVADDAADNAREDRKADSIISDRARRTDIAAGRAATADRRESRLTGGRGRSGGGQTVLKNGTVIKGRKDGKTYVYYNGQLKPLGVAQ